MLDTLAMSLSDKHFCRTYHYRMSIVIGHSRHVGPLTGLKINSDVVLMALRDQRARSF